jgi:hypothetical protein
MRTILLANVLLLTALVVPQALGEDKPAIPADPNLFAHEEVISHFLKGIVELLEDSDADRIKSADSGVAEAEEFANRMVYYARNLLDDVSMSFAGIEVELRFTDAVEPMRNRVEDSTRIIIPKKWVREPKLYKRLAVELYLGLVDAKLAATRKRAPTAAEERAERSLHDRIAKEFDGVVLLPRPDRVKAGGGGLNSSKLPTPAPKPVELRITDRGVFTQDDDKASASEAKKAPSRDYPGPSQAHGLEWLLELGLYGGIAALVSFAVVILLAVRIGVFFAKQPKPPLNWTIIALPLSSALAAAIGAGSGFLVLQFAAATGHTSESRDSLIVLQAATGFLVSVRFYLKNLPSPNATASTPPSPPVA